MFFKLEIDIDPHQTTSGADVSVRLCREPDDGKL